jgi:hypothetical protein
MTQPFILLSTQRSGSTWVIDMLNSHPRITAYGELLLEDGRGKRYGGELDLEFFDEFLEVRIGQQRNESSREILFQYLNKVYEPSEDLQALGFKLMYGQFGAYPDLKDYLIGNEIAIVHLIRVNLLDILISKETAVRRNVFHYPAEERPQEVKVRLDPGQILTRLEEQEREVERVKKRFTAFGIPYREIFYEELAADAAKFIDVLEFLGVRPLSFSLRSRLRRMNVLSQSELVSNYAEVKAVLAGSNFVSFLTS